MSRLILASKSASRRALLSGAGLNFDAVGSDVDENVIKDAELGAGATPADVALTLAIAKAQAIDGEGSLVLGGDQVLEFDGRLYDKPQTMEEAADRLELMSGKAHFLRSGLALAKDGDIVWTHRETCTLWMRDVTRAEIDAYLANVGTRVLATVGAYELEGPGVRLFEKIDGDYFSILGLPLFPLLSELRQRGQLPW